MKSIFSAAFLLLLFFQETIAQTAAKPIFTRLGKKEGLASEAVFQAVQDRRGFIWFATENGLQRYDGHNFLTFHNKPGDSLSIPSEFFNKLFVDSKNRLWLISGGVLGIFNTSKFTFQKITTTPKVGFIRKLIEDKRGRILLLSDITSVLMFNENTMAFDQQMPLPALPTGYRFDNLVEDIEPGRFWITTRQGLLYYDGKTLSFPENKLEGDTTRIDHIRNTRYPFVASDGSLWFVSWIPFRSIPTLYNYQPKTKTLKTYGDSKKKLIDANYEIWAIREMQDGSIWINGQNMLGYLDKKTDQFVHLKSVPLIENEIEYDYVVELFEDRERNVWINSNKGLYRFNKQLQYFSYQANKRSQDTSLIAEHVTAILPVSQNETWVATRGKGIFCYDRSWKPVENRFNSLDTAHRSLEIISMIQRKDGDIWLGLRNGQILIYHPSINKVESFFLPGAKTESIRTMLEDRSKNIWIGNNSGDLYRFDKGNWKDSLRSIHLIDSQISPVTRLYEDWSGNIWIGTIMDGLYKREASSGKLLHHYVQSKGKNDGLSTDMANDVVQYNDSIILIASNNLSILNTRTNKFEYITAEHGIPSERIINIVVDKKKRIWIAMLNGIYRLNLEKKIPILYSEVNGMQNSNIEINSAAVFSDGGIAMGTFRDFVIFNPDAVIDTTKVPSVVLTGIKVLDKPVMVDSALRNAVSLKYDQSALTIEFATLNFSRHYTVMYKLEGLDKEWRATSEMKVSYPYLPSGNYVFRVQAVNEEGIVGEPIDLLHINVQRPFWRAWWFWAIVAASVLAFLYWLDRKRIKRREYIQQMRTDIAVNLHQEVNTALNKINLLSEVAGMKADYEIEKSKEYIQQIRTKSRHMIVAMNDMLWSIDPANDDMRKTIERFAEYLQGLNNDVQGSFELHTDKEVYQTNLDMQTRFHSIYLFKAVIEYLIDFSVRKADLFLVMEKSGILYRVVLKEESLNDYDLQGLLKEGSIMDRLELLKGYAEMKKGREGVELVFSIGI